MIRYFLAKGDRGGQAVITEGLEDVTCSAPPPSVNIATLYMKTYCAACNQEGFISPKGPRWEGTGSNGQPWALSGDINVCGCNPPPTFYAERDMMMIFESEHAAALMGGSRGELHSSTGAGVEHDEQYVLRDEDTGWPLARMRYRIYTKSGQVFSGITDASGHTQRVTTSGAENLRIDIVENNDV
ncbi:hypothetical protein [Burkholderia aenigmatica]|uniref:PAAR domain-containing protein n=1 Tax=Burkholderia aenigmatica TaxID=2015348 RepID=A0A228IWA0_9BURK|nr:hypothetical protein [Burkholderia aenigmatica]OXI46439.1 hypothetical protein CFB84_16695 [Burkholderia aenigmatica]